jgi:hypothetical protein
MDAMWAIIFMGGVFILVGFGAIAYDELAKRSNRNPSSKKA